jgi:hypothetical protein
MTTRVLFYLVASAFGVSIANSCGPNSPLQLLEMAVPVTLLLVAIVSAGVLSLTWFVVCQFLEQYSDRSQVACAVVHGLVNPGGDGQAKLPDVISVGGKRRLRLTELYNMPIFRFAQELVRAIGLPCRLLFKLASPCG